MLEIMYLNVYTFSFVNFVTTFAICLPTNFHFLLYFTKVGQTVFCNGWPDTPELRAQNVTCASHSAHSCSGASILWYHWVLELVSKGDCFVYVQFGPVEVLGKASDVAWQGKTPDTKPTDLNLIPRIHLVEGQSYIFRLSSEYWTCALMEYTYMQSHYTYIYIHIYTQHIHTHVEHIHAYIYTHVMHRHVHIIKMCMDMYGM